MRWGTVAFIGLCCSSLCALGLPLLAVWLSAWGLGWVLNELLMRGMALMFLTMMAGGMVGTYQHHRAWGPGLLAFGGGGVLLGTVWHVLPRPTGWVALGVLTAAWWLDHHLMQKAHHATQD